MYHIVLLAGRSAGR